MVKSVDEIRDEVFDNDKLSQKSINDLIWHLENDKSPHKPIMLVTDARLKNLFPLITKFLDHEDDFVREVAVGCVVGRLELAEYAEKAFNMAKNDQYDNVRDLAVSSLGAVINKVNPALRKQIANYLYEIVINDSYDNLYRQCAYESILKAMDVPMQVWPQLQRNPDMSEIIDKILLEEFKQKYNIGKTDDTNVIH